MKFSHVVFNYWYTPLPRDKSKQITNRFTTKPKRISTFSPNDELVVHALHKLQIPNANGNGSILFKQST
jgi:hypothetical protein